jgi:hypothetical protein
VRRAPLIKRLRRMLERLRRLELSWRGWELPRMIGNRVSCWCEFGASRAAVRRPARGRLLAVWSIEVAVRRRGGVRAHRAYSTLLNEPTFSE